MTLPASLRLNCGLPPHPTTKKSTGSITTPTNIAHHFMVFTSFTDWFGSEPKKLSDPSITAENEERRDRAGMQAAVVQSNQTRSHSARPLGQFELFYFFFIFSPQAASEKESKRRRRAAGAPELSFVSDQTNFPSLVVKPPFTLVACPQTMLRTSLSWSIVRTPSAAFLSEVRVIQLS